MLRQEYNISKDVTTLPIQNWDVLLEQNLYVMMDDETNVLKQILMVLNMFNFIPNKKLIVFNTNEGKLKNL
jgi:hypothetical protein